MLDHPSRTDTQSFLPPGVTSVADLQRHYRGVRARIEKAPPPKKALPKPEPKPDPEPQSLKADEKRERDIIDVYSCPDALDLLMDSVRPSAKQIITGIERSHNVPPGSITGPRRDKATVKARYHAIKVIAEVYPDWSLPRIGRVFGRDHTTILHALRKMEVQRQ